jgi:hypothetical protein
MIPLLVLIVWVLALALVVGLCVTARAGDVAQLAEAPTASGWGSSQAPSWEREEHLVISAGAARVHAGDSHVAAESDASLAHSGGIAA